MVYLVHFFIDFLQPIKVEGHWWYYGHEEIAMAFNGRNHKGKILILLKKVKIEVFRGNQNQEVNYPFV